MHKSWPIAAIAAALIAGTLPALAEPFSFLPQAREPAQIQAYANPANDELRAEFQRRVVTYGTKEAPGTIIVDTTNTYLYLVLGGGKALRYGIGVGREGFTWSGVKTIERKAEWPDWTPPPEMIARQPYLPRFVAGGETNPLGARAMYLSCSVYRIHGTNAPETIGEHVSSGCIRMVNEDVIDLYNRALHGPAPLRRKHRDRGTHLASSWSGKLRHDLLTGWDAALHYEEFRGELRSRS
jgi:lipoprotein-anchoring transpeptidase ErfK/SrfK